MNQTSVGPYLIDRELGRGGMGIVYAGRHAELGRSAAIKLLLSDADQTPHARERFQLECESLGRLQHPGIVRVYESGFHEGRPWVALELIKGAPLDEVLAREGPWPVERAFELGIALCEAIEHAHSLGILHRDLKPENVLLDEALRPRVTDFGLAKDLNATSLTASGIMLGTPAYMPPEQASGDRGLLGPGADVYGLGATLYRVVTGEAPFSGPTAVNIVTQIYLKPPPRPSAVRPGLDEGVDALLLRCLEKDPGARFASAAELGCALRAYLDGERAVRSPRYGLALGVAALLGLGALGVGLALSLPSGDSTPAPSLSVADLKQRAGSELRKLDSVTELRAWIRVRSKEAEPKDRERALTRLAEKTWEALPPSQLGASALPDVEDLSRLERYRAVRAWAAEHLEFAGKIVAEQAGLELAHQTKAVRVLAVLGNKGEAREEQDPYFMPGGDLLVYGRGASVRRYDLLGASRDELVYRGTKQTQALVNDQGLWALAPEAVALIGEPVPPLRLPGYLRANALVVIGDHLLIGGSYRSGQHMRGAALLMSMEDVRAGKAAPPFPTLRFRGPVESGVLHPNGEWAYLGGGGTDADEGNGFLAQVALVDGAPVLLDSVEVPASAKQLVVTPDETQILVGLNRGGARAYGLNLKGGCDKARELALGLELPGLKAHRSIGSVTVQSQGFLYLPSGRLLYSTDLYNDAEERGFLSLYEPAALVIRSGRGLEASNSERRGPVWSVRMPFQTRRLALSADESLLAVGTSEGRVLLLPWQPASR